MDALNVAILASQEYLATQLDLKLAAVMAEVIDRKVRRTAQGPLGSDGGPTS